MDPFVYRVAKRPNCWLNAFCISLGAIIALKMSSQRHDSRLFPSTILLAFLSKKNQTYEQMKYRYRNHFLLVLFGNIFKTMFERASSFLMGRYFTSGLHP